MEEDEDDDLDLPISPKDVYDLAADIAAEFENVASVCGHETVNNLVHKVVVVLEHLETAVNKLQASGSYVSNLRQQISDLLSSKTVNAENKIKLEQDLADVEESWIKEIQELKSNLNRLQEDNKHLHNLLSEHLCLEQLKDRKSDALLVQELQDIVTSLTTRLKDKDSLIEKHISDISLLKSSLEQEDRVNQLLHNRISESQAQIDTLWQDKTDLKMKVMKQEEMLETMQHQLMESMFYKTNYEQTGDSGRSFVSELQEQNLHEESLNHCQQEREVLLSRIDDLERELITAEKQLNEYQQMYTAGSSRMQRWHSLSAKGSAIRQLFRYFLGVVARETENFRP